MKNHFVYHKLDYIATWFTVFVSLFCGYYTITIFININLWLLIILGIIISTIIEFIYFYQKASKSAYILFKTIISNDDRGLYRKLVKEFGENLGEYIYYSQKNKALKYYLGRRIRK